MYKGIITVRYLNIRETDIRQHPRHLCHLYQPIFGHRDVIGLPRSVLPSRQPPAPLAASTDVALRTGAEGANHPSATA